MNTLAHEARRMHACFVAKTAPSEDLIATYLAAREHLALDENRLVARLVASVADLRAAEVVLRGRNPRNELTTLALLILSLAEVRPEYLGLFIEERRAPVRAWARLIFAIPTFLYQRSKGTILLWWHERHA